MKEKAFDTFVAAKCEEILTMNVEYSQLSDKILEVQREIKKILSSSELELFNEFERLSVEQQALGEYLCLKTYFEI